MKQINSSAKDKVSQREQIITAGYKHVRKAHDTEIAEDYVEVIQDLIQNRGEARAVDIAKRLGVTHVTVTKTIGRLQKQGFVSTQPYRSIFLTDLGLQMAKQCRERHEIVYSFLKKLGIPEDIALIDAEGIEHHVSKQTLKAFKDFSIRK